MKKSYNFLLIILFICSSFEIAGAALHDPGADASVYNQFNSPYLSESDSGLNSAYASITLATGEDGSAKAYYNSGVHVRSNSSVILDNGDYGFGDSIVSRASQRTIFDITSNLLAPGTQVTGTVNINLEGSITNIGNKDYGEGSIDLSVSFGDPNGSINNLFTGNLIMTKGDLSYTGFNNFGVVIPNIATGNPYLSFDFNTTAEFTGLVGEQFSIEYLLQAQYSLVYDVNFFNTGTFNISFENGQDAFALVVPQSTVPVPGAVWLLASGLLGFAGIRRNKLKNKRG